MTGCQTSESGCMVPPMSVSAEKATAVVQVTTMRVVQVEVPWAWARLSSSNPRTVRILDAKGSSR